MKFGKLIGGENEFLIWLREICLGFLTTNFLVLFINVILMKKDLPFGFGFSGFCYICLAFFQAYERILNSKVF